jgi:hypothetical protein
MKTVIIILCMLIALASIIFVSCDRTGRALQEQLRDEIEWYNDTTRIATTRIHDDLWVVSATHTWNENVQQVDVYFAERNIDGDFEFRNVYNGGKIN